MIPTELRDSGRGFSAWLIESPELLEKVQPISAHFDLKVIKLDPEVGKAHFEYNVPDLYLNYMGGVHGGAIATLLDDASCMTAGLLVGSAFKGTVSSTIDYYKSVKNQKVSVKAMIINYSTSLIFGEASLFCNDQIYAKSSSVMSYRNKN